MDFFCGLFKIQTWITVVVYISGNKGCDNYPTWGANWGSGFFAENTLPSGTASAAFSWSFASNEFLIFAAYSSAYRGRLCGIDQLGEPPWYFIGTLFFFNFLLGLYFMGTPWLCSSFAMVIKPPESVLCQPKLQISREQASYLSLE